MIGSDPGALHPAMVPVPTPHPMHPVGEHCDVFKPANMNRPMTVALSILVTIEMFNAFNSLSENQSLLLVPPWDNKYLVGAVALSFVLHFGILYIPFLAKVFSVAPMNAAEWTAVVWFSFPVILIDEQLKFISRYLQYHGRLGRAAPRPRKSAGGGGGGLVAGLKSFFTPDASAGSYTELATADTGLNGNGRESELKVV